MAGDLQLLLVNRAPMITSISMRASPQQRFHCRVVDPQLAVRPRQRSPNGPLPRLRGRRRRRPRLRGSAGQMQSLIHEESSRKGGALPGSRYLVPHPQSLGPFGGVVPHPQSLGAFGGVALAIPEARASLKLRAPNSAGPGGPPGSIGKLSLGPRMHVPGFSPPGDLSYGVRSCSWGAR